MATSPIVHLPLEPTDSARAAGLRYVTDLSPGIQRVQKGKGFRYQLPTNSSLYASLTSGSQWSLDQLRYTVSADQCTEKNVVIQNQHAVLNCPLSGAVGENECRLQV